jgi:hypothetical protein
VVSVPEAEGIAQHSFHQSMPWAKAIISSHRQPCPYFPFILLVLKMLAAQMSPDISHCAVVTVCGLDPAETWLLRLQASIPWVN